MILGRAWAALTHLVGLGSNVQPRAPREVSPAVDPRFLRPTATSRRRWVNPRYPVRFQGTRERTRRQRQAA